MEPIKASDVINRVMNLKEFTVTRLEDEVVFNGSVPFTIRGRTGSPFMIKVFALSQMEAEQKVDDWQKEMRSV